MTDTRYASRKFILASAAFVGGVVFFSIGKLSPAEWTAFTQWVLGLYLAGNVGDTVAERAE